MNTPRTDDQLALVGVYCRRTNDAPPAHMAINASGLDEIDIRRELIARGVEPGFNITSKFIVTRQSLDVLPVQVRHEWRIQYRELVRAERKEKGLKPWDMVDEDWAVDCWSLGAELPAVRLSRE